MPDIATIEKRAYETALKGTPVNPGVPDKLAKLIVSQTKHETATRIGEKMVAYTSNAFTRNNNAIGYKFVGSRYQVGPGIKSSEGDYYGAYADYTDSIQELVDWIYRRVKEGKFPADLRTIDTADKYAALLKSAGYFGDPLTVYAGGLKAWFKENIKTVAVGSGLVILPIIAYFGYQLIKRKK